MATGRIERMRSSGGFLILVVAFAALSDTFLYNVIMPALPNILEDHTGVPHDEVQTWTSTLLAVYGVAFLITPTCVGAIIDRTPSKQAPFTAGLIVMAAATFLFFIGTKPWVLAVARIFQGASAGIVWTAGTAYMVSVLGAENSGTAMGWVSSLSSMGEVMGPVVGGVVYGLGGHGAVFAVAMGVVGVDIALRLCVKTKKRAQPAEQNGQIDETQPLLPDPGDGKYGSVVVNETETSRSSSIDATGEANDSGSSSGSETMCASASSLGSKTEQGAFSMLELARDTNFLSSLWAMVMASSMRTALEATIPLAVQDRFNWSSSASGLVLLGLAGQTLFSPLIGHAAERIGPRWISTCALLVSGPLFFILGCSAPRPTPDAPVTAFTKTVFCAAVMGIGLCACLAWIPQLITIAFIAERSGSGQPYAMMNTAYALGMTLGPIWAGALNDKWGWSVMCWSMGAVVLVTSTAELLTWRSWGSGERAGLCTAREAAESV